MNEIILIQINLFLKSFMVGVFLAFVYDIIRIIRITIKHSKVLIAVQDIIFWMYVGIRIFIMLLNNNDGEIRMYAIAGAAMGVFIYKISLGKIFVKIYEIIVKRLKKLCKSITMNKRRFKDEKTQQKEKNKEQK